MAEDIIGRYFTDYDKVIRKIDSPKSRVIFASAVMEQFRAAIKAATSDPEVVGFKSVVCYRTGLAVPSLKALTSDAAKRDEAWASLISRHLSGKPTRLEQEHLNPYFLHVASGIIESSPSAAQHRKPLQFHTGLGDNDISLRLSSPSYLQPFIKEYPKLPIVLLHASYPFTREAGYLASVYENVYLDIGEVFPMVSQEGQEKVVSQALELCPSEKLTWSTDGHWFPETYLLAVIQIREALERVLRECIEKKTLEAAQAIHIVEDLLFRTSNRLYELNLPLAPLPLSKTKTPSGVSSKNVSRTKEIAILKRFIDNNPDVKFLRLQWLDYTSTHRVRILPMKRALAFFQEGEFISITKAVLGLLQTDMAVTGFGAVGAYNLVPCFDGIRRGDGDSYTNYATVPCEFRENNQDTVSMCPRTTLRKIVEKAREQQALDFLIGFEVEVVFMNYEVVDGSVVYGGVPVSHGHGWSSTRALHSLGSGMLSILEAIMSSLENARIGIQQFHPEAGPGQYEFVLEPLPPLQAVDTLLATRDIISTIAAKSNLRATYVPKPIPLAAGSGSHIHMSLSPQENYEMFYAGILKHLPALTAFTYCNESSYERAVDSVWAGGRWVTWGTQNREAPLRKIKDSHWELKAADGFANMYLVLAAVLGAGLQGILDKEEMTWKDCQVDPAELKESERNELGIKDSLPSNLQEALRLLDQDVQLKEIVGDDAVRTFLAVKRAEAEMLEKMEPEKRRHWLIERY